MARSFILIAKRPARAFSLLDFLTVIAIIALVISIVLPALGGAREAARKLNTQSIFGDFDNAVQQFRLDNADRLPGYFTPAEMGSDQNASRGMSAMENVMIDLAGAGAIVDPADFDASQHVRIGPDAATEIIIDPDLIGVGENVYFPPPPKFWKAQTNDPGLVQQFGVAGHTGPEGAPQMPDLIDAWGQPVLAWVEDDAVGSRVIDSTDFIVENSGTDGATRALFYWNSNKAFLAANSLGKKGEDQSAGLGGPETSLIGSGTDWDNERRNTLAALLGSTAYPIREGQNGSSELTDTQTTIPSTSRGRLIIHSAGTDGFYLGSGDDGLKKAGSDKTRLYFGLNFFDGGSNRLKDDSGVDTSRDVIAEFDDVVVPSGG